MVVVFTPNIGLAKPDETEIAEKWVNIDQLQADNNLIIRDKMDINILSYTPVIKGSTSDPSLGAGSTRGEYCDFQGIIFGSFIIDWFDPGIAVGSGDFAISLPAVIDNTFHTVATAFNGTIGAPSVIGEGYAFDFSNTNASGQLALDACTVAGVSYCRLITEVHTVPAKTNRVVNPTNYFGPANGDRYMGNFIYKKL